MMKTIIKIVLFAFLSTCYCQDGFVIKNVKVFDGDTIFENTSVRIEDGKIAELGPFVKINKQDSVIDGLGKSLMPALFNAHVHAWAPQSLKQAANAGVLNVMDMHGVEPFQAAMRQLKDSTNYARFFVAGYAATAPEGHGTQFGFPVPTLTGPEDAKKFIEDRLKANVDHIKIIVEPWKKTLGSETVAALIEEAHKANKVTVVHVSRLENAIDVLKNKADGLAHIWWDKPIEDVRLQELINDKPFFVIPTLLTTLKAFETMGEGATAFMDKQELLNEIKKLHDAGVLLLAGTDPPNLGINYGTDLYKELQLLREAGLSQLEVLKSGTSNVVQAFGLENLGYIKPSFSADLILINGDVTQDISALHEIEQIWKRGQRVNVE